MNTTIDLPSEAQLARRLWRVATKMLLGNYIDEAEWGTDRRRHEHACVIAAYLVTHHTPSPPGQDALVEASSYNNIVSFNKAIRTINRRMDDHPACKIVLDRWTQVRDRAFIRPWHEIPPAVMDEAHDAWRGN